jgi:hypothetical protein
VSPEIQELWERALRALQTADELVDRDSDASSSRAYYAAFYAVSALLALEGQSYSKHTAVERAVHRDFVKTGKFPPEVGAAFSWLANLRYTADYGGSEHAETGDAGQAATAHIWKQRPIIPRYSPLSADMRRICGYEPLSGDTRHIRRP